MCTGKLMKFANPTPKLAIAGTLLASTLASLLFATDASAQAPRADATTDATSWSSGTYEYDGAGNIKQVGEDRYRYDEFGRLKDAEVATVTSPQNRQIFTYDRFGNLFTVTTITGSETEVAGYAVNAGTNQLDDATACPPNVTCRMAFYDPAGSGHQVGFITPDEYQWDALGSMTELDSHRGDRHERYIYDANGERILVVARNAAGAETEQRFAIRGVDTKVVRELTFIPSTNTWTQAKDYVHRRGALIASFSTASVVPDRHYHSDHLGSVRLMTDGAGQRLAVHTYWAYGQEARGSDVDNERMKFTGHERDGSHAAGGLELDYMHARYYDPSLSRFSSVDPILDAKRAMKSPQMWNRYSYAVDNPLRFVDPNGMLSYETTVLGATVHVHIDDDLNKEIQQELKAKIDEAFARINAGKEGLSQQEQGIVKLIKSLDVRNVASSVDPQTGKFSMNSLHLAMQSSENFAADYLHDSKHVFNAKPLNPVYTEWFVGRFRQSFEELDERDASEFAVQTSAKLNLNPDATWKYQEKLIDSICNHQWWKD